MSDIPEAVYLDAARAAAVTWLDGLVAEPYARDVVSMPAHRAAVESAYRAGQQAALVGEDALGVHAEVTQVTVCAVDERSDDWMELAITVEKTAPDRWAVRRHRRCLSRSGGWVWESVPTERTDEFLAEHRFGFAEALRRAREAAPHVTVNGYTAERVNVEWRQGEVSTS